MGAPVTEIETEPVSTGDLRPSRSRTRWVWTGLAALLLVGLAVLVVSTRPPADGADDITANPQRTAPVTVETITDTRSFPGTLGHGDPHTVAAAREGTLTGVPDQGIEVVTGVELFRVDERPVTAMIGDVPMFRDLSRGDSGADVAQLVANLTALGHADCDTEDEYTACVRDAVRDWQESIGVEVTGLVGRGDVGFVPEGTRVDTIHSKVGDRVSPGSPVLDLAHASQVVALEVEVRHRDLLGVGSEVDVRFAGGVVSSGVVTSASVVAAPGGSGPDDTVARIRVTLTTAVDQSLLGSPVEVVVAVDSRTDVLTVPISALLALVGGGHGLEVVNPDGSTNLVPVETGLFAAGRVEVTAEGIAEGTTVVVAGR